MNKTKKISALLLLFVFLSSVFALPARADFWGASMGATTFQITTEKMLKSIEDTLVANLKIAAIRIINGRLSVLLTGSAGQYGGGGAVIGNWQDFIYGTAQRYALAATNDFFTQIRSGIPNTLANRVVGPAQKAVAEGIWNAPPDLQNYVANGDASQIFSSSTRNPWMAWRMAAMPQNDLAFTYLRAAGLKQATYEQQAKLQSDQAIAGQGYKSATRQATASNGKQVTVPAGSDYQGAQNITTPGSTVKSISEEILKMPLSMLNYASTIPQVVTSMVNSMITQVIQSGVNKVTDPIDQQIVKARNQAGQSLGQMQGAIQGGIVNATTQSNSSSGTKLFK